MAMRRATLVGTVLLLTLGCLLPSAWGAPPAGVRGTPLPATAPAAPLPVAPGWSMYHGGPLLAGVAPSSAPSHPHLLWQLQLPIDTATPPGPGNTEHPFQSSPVLAQGLLLVPSNGVLYEVNATTGALVNSVDLQNQIGYGPLVATPTVTNRGVVGVALDGGTNYAGTFTLASGTASAACPFNNRAIASSLAPIPGPALLAADDSGNVNIINLATSTCGGVTYNKAPGGPSYRATPSVAYVAGRGWNAYLPDYGSGAVDVFRVPQGGASTQIALPPSVSNLWGSMAVANVTNGTQVYPTGFLADEVGTGSTSLLWAVNLSSASTYPGSLQLLSGPTVDSGVEGTPLVWDAGGAVAHLVFGNDTGNLTAYAYSVAGRGSATLLWNRSCGRGSQFVASPVLARPTLSGGALVVDGTTGGWICAVDAASGALAWKLHFNGSFFATPAVAGGTVFGFTSTGTLFAIDTASPPVTVQPPSPPVSGSTATVNVWVGAINATGRAVGNLRGALVSLATTGGFILAPNPAPTNGLGWAQFNWSTPAGLTASASFVLTASVSAIGYAPTQASATAQVSPAPPPPPVYALHPTVTSGSATVVVGGTTPVNVTVLGAGGAPLSGALVQLTLVGSGTVTPSFGTTGPTGLFSASFVAPATLPPVPAGLVVANVSAPGYYPSQNATAIEVVPASAVQLPSLGLNVSSTLSVTVGGVVPFQVVVTNQTDPLRAPVAGATVQVTGSPAGSGSFSGSATTDALGIAFWNFTAPAAPGAVLALLQASATGYIGASGALAITVQPSSSNPGSLSIAAQAAPPFEAGTLLPIQLQGTVSPTVGASYPAAGAVVQVALTAGAGSLNTTMVTLSGLGLGWVGLRTPNTTLALQEVLSVSISLGSFVGASTTLPLLVLPRPLSASASLASDLEAGHAGTLGVALLSGGSAPAGLWVNVSVGAGSGGGATLGPSASQVSDASGRASFTLTFTGVPGDVVTLVVAAGAPGYRPAWANVSVTLQAPPASTGTAAAGPLSLLDASLLGLVLLFLVAFVIAMVAGRRRRPPGPVAGTEADAGPSGEGPSAPEAPIDAGAPESAGPLEQVHPTEYDEDIDHHETHPVGVATETVAAPGPPEEGSEAPTEGPEAAPTEGSDDQGTAPIVVETEEGTEPTAGSEGGRGGATEDGAAPSGSDDAVHVELERTLGKERPSVEEANPFGDEIQPEEVNPNVQRIPKRLLQPAEMRIQSDGRVEGEGSADEASERQRAQETRTRDLVEKAQRARRTSSKGP